MNTIEVNNLTKDYGHNRGVFNLNFQVKKGEIYGFLGPNGAGKTTTIRHLLGFSKPDEGQTFIDGMNCWLQPSIIQKQVGYIPGEISLPDNMTGGKFIKMVADLRCLKDMTYADALIKRFDLDVKTNLKRMSKGTKQKIGIVVAFMHNPDILLLDEPSSGLDPLMQAEFIELLREEKQRGKTILLSSHMFDEVEKTCDRVSIIKQGKIVTTINVKDIEHRNNKTFEIKFQNLEDVKKFKLQNYELIEYNEEKTRVKINIDDKDINLLIQTLSAFKIVYMSEIKYTLEDYFMNFYKEDKK